MLGSWPYTVVSLLENGSLAARSTKSLVYPVLEMPASEGQSVRPLGIQSGLIPFCERFI